VNTKENGDGRAPAKRQKAEHQRTRTLDAIKARVNDGTATAADLAALQNLVGGLKEYRRTMDLGAIAEAKILEHLGNRKSDRLCLADGAANLRRDLGEDTSSPLERVLIQECVCSYLNVNAIRFQYEERMAGSMSVGLAMYWEKKLTMAQRRLLKSTETLARVRKMRLPDLQVNIAMPGSQQVNAQTVEAADAAALRHVK
jgi:hypothetical protein